MKLLYELDYTHTSDLGQKEVHFRPWTAKEEKDYLELLEKQKELNESTLFRVLIKPVIKEKDIVLTSAQIKKLMYDIRSVSISNIIEDEYECEECGSKHNIKVNISEGIKYKESTFKPIKVQDIEIIFKEPTTNSDLKYLNLESGVIQYIFLDFIRFIDTIIYKDKTYSNMKFNEKKDFIFSLPSNIFDEVFDKYKEYVDDFSLDYKFECTNCNHTENLDYSLAPNLLWV